MFKGNISCNLSDEELVKLVKFDNNNEALNILLHKYQPIIMSKIRSFNFDAFEIDDIYQECILGLYSIIFDYSPIKSSFRTFSSVCINRILLSILRNKSKKGSIPIDFIADFNEESIIADSDTPEQILERYDNFEALLSKVKKRLSSLEYKVLLKLFAGLSYKEISEDLSVSAKSVDNAVQRIRKKFYEII